MTTPHLDPIGEKKTARLAAWRSWRPFLVAFLVVGLVLAAAPARAIEYGDVAVSLVGWVVDLLTSFLGQILLMLVNVLINVAQYNDFVSAPAVATGWVIVRDVVNMFFILIILVRAFGTILGVEEYSFKGGSLVSLIIMAVIINFSRTICGLMIDLGQVVMLTFVSGFKDAAGGNFVEALRINEVMQAASGNPDASSTAIVLSLLLGLVMTAIAVFIVLMMTITLIVRIVYLWLLIVLSPLAFLLRAVPGGQAKKAYADWWDKFTSNILVGPVQAFFLWLALVTVQQGDISAGFQKANLGENISDSVSAAFNAPSLQSFMIAVCLLLVGYMLAQEVGGATSGVASKIGQAGLGVAKKAALRTAAFAGRSGLRAVGATGLTAGATNVINRGLGGLMSVPLVKGLAARALVANRSKQAERVAKADKFVAGLPPDLRGKMRTSRFTGALSPEGRAMNAAIAKDELATTINFNKPTADVAAAAKEAKKYEKIDPSLSGTLYKAKLARPGIMLDDVKRYQELDRKKSIQGLTAEEEVEYKGAEKENKTFKDIVGRLSPQKIAEMDPSDLTPELMAYMKPQSMDKALPFAGGAVAEKIESFKASQDAQKQVGDMQQQRLAPTVAGMSREEIGGLAAADLGPVVLQAVATAQKGGDLKPEQVAKIDVKSLGQNRDLAGQIAAGLRSAGIKAVADAGGPAQAAILSSALQNSNQQQFKFDNSGNFAGSGSEANASRFAAAVSSPQQAREMAQAVDPRVLGANGGVNQVTMHLATNLNVETVNQMAQSGENAVLDAIKGIAAVDPDQIASQILDKIEPRLEDEADNDAARVASLKRLTKQFDEAKAKAKDLVKAAERSALASAAAVHDVKRFKR